MNDPIRIFLKNPWNLSRKSTGDLDTEVSEEWYFAFTGFISAVTEDFNAESNMSTLHLFCEDTRKLLRYMRTTTSPNVFNINVADGFVSTLDNATADTRELFGKFSGDAVMLTGNAAIQAGMTLVNVDPQGKGNDGVMDLLLFGDTGNAPSDSFKLVDKDSGTQKISGFMGFRRENKVVLQIPGTDVVESQTSAQMDVLYPALSESDVDLYGADWSLGASNEVAPELNRLYVIIPSSSLFKTVKWPYDWQMRIEHFNEFVPRLDVINEYVKNQDSTWYTTPKGDMVVEFPQYDMTPQKYSAPWNNILQIQNEFTRFSSKEDDRNIMTFTIANGSALDGVQTEQHVPFFEY